MIQDNFNKQLRLINLKPTGEQMIENDYAFYMFPIPVMVYANKVLTDRERRLYFAIAGQSGENKNGKPCHWAISHFCAIAHIKSNHYSEVLEGLCKKGFIIHKNFESIKVLYPISEEEYIAPNGEIKRKATSPDWNEFASDMIEFSSLQEHFDEEDIDEIFGTQYSQDWNIDNIF